MFQAREVMDVLSRGRDHFLAASSLGAAYAWNRNHAENDVAGMVVAVWGLAGSWVDPGDCDTYYHVFVSLLLLYVVVL